MKIYNSSIAATEITFVNIKINFKKPMRKNPYVNNQYQSIYIPNQNPAYKSKPTN